VDIADLLHAVVRRLVRAPALHFALLGGLIYFGWSWAGEGPGDRQRVEIPTYRIEAAVKEFEKTVARPATPHEVRRVATIVADQEVLLAYALDLELDREPIVERRLAQIAQFLERDPNFEKVKHAADQAKPARSSSEFASEARELGLHQQDLITRRILIDNARRLIRAAALVREPTEQMLSDYLSAHPGQFERPGETRITQLHFRPGVHGDAVRSEAEALLRRLQSEGLRPQEAEGLVEASVLPRDLPLLSDREIARHFGSRFTQSLSELSVGSWQGPIASPYGLHLVYVHERTPVRVPDLSEIRTQVVSRTRQKLADDWLALRLAQLREAYEVVLPRGI
jgi:hypothetical protein